MGNILQVIKRQKEIELAELEKDKHNGLPIRINPNSYTAKEISYQTVLLKEINEDLQEIKTLLKVSNESDIKNSLREEFKPKGKFVPKIGEKYWYVTTFGAVFRTTYGGADDEYLLNNSPVFKTEEEVEDYKLFREQVAELRKPFIYRARNYCFVYDYNTKKVDASYVVSVQYGTLIFGYIFEEIEKVRDILGDDRIKKYLLDVWE